MKYEKPLIFLNDTRAESVYMLSGTISDVEISDIGNTAVDNPEDNLINNPADNTVDNPADNTVNNPADNTVDNPADNIVINLEGSAGDMVGEAAAGNPFSDGSSGNGAVSGDIGGFSDGTSVGGNTVKCDSIYMQGVWQGPDYSDWNGATRGYRQQFGCLGCPAYRWDGCGLLSDYAASGSASSYDADNGNRKPSWEKKGYGPDNTVTDWNM